MNTLKEEGGIVVTLLFLLSCDVQSISGIECKFEFATVWILNLIGRYLYN